MDILKISLFGFAAIIMVILLKSCKSEWASLLSIGAGVIISIYMLSFLSQLSEMFSTWQDYMTDVSPYMSILWKALGITYLCEFTGNVCRDNGNLLIAGQVELCGKIAVMLLGMPILWALIETVAGYYGG